MIIWMNDCISSFTLPHHYGDVIMSATASQITGLTIVYSAVYSGADQRKHQSSASLAFVRGIPGEFPAQRPVTRKTFSFDDVIMVSSNWAPWRVYFQDRNHIPWHNYKQIWPKANTSIRNGNIPIINRLLPLAHIASNLFYLQRVAKPRLRLGYG